MINRLTRGIWTIAFDLELARERYAGRGQLWRQAGACVVLAILRAGGVRHV